MLLMDINGVCRGHKGAKPANLVASYDFGDAGVLSLWAQPVESLDQLDCCGETLLRVPLPLPFGRTLMVAPLVWTHRRAGAEATLTPKKLDEMLWQLKDVRKETTASVLLTPLTARTMVVDSVPDAEAPPSDDELSQYDSGDEGSQSESDEGCLDDEACEAEGEEDDIDDT